MERLTSKYWRNLDPWEMCGQDNYCKRGCHDQGGCTKGCIVPRIYGRLATYEDTGLEPQDIISAVDMSKIACALHELNAYKDLGPIDHIRDLIKAEQDGRLVVLPCKVGDHVWIDGRDAIVTEFFGYRSERYFHAVILGRNKHIDIPFTEIGKTVFLTRQEAEAALAEKGSTNEDSGCL